MAKSYKERVKALEEYKPPKPEEMLVRRTRQRAADTGSGRRSAAPESKNSSGLDYFQERVKSDFKLHNAYYSLGMVGALLRDSYKNPRPGESVCQIMGFDPENLQNLMRAIFSRIQGSTVKGSDVVAYLSMPNTTQFEILYYAVLGLKDDSEPSEIDAKCEQLAKEISAFEELLAYPGVANVNRAIGEAKMNEDSDENIEDIVKKYGLPIGEAEPFDEDMIEHVLSSMESGMPAASPGVGANTAYFANFYIENQELAEPLKNFQNAYTAEEWLTIGPKLDDKFPAKDGMGLSFYLNDALEGGKNVADLLQAISEGFEVTDPEELKQKINELNQAIKELKPELFEEAAAPAAEEAAEERTMDYRQFFDEEVKGNAEMLAAFQPLYNLFYAIKRSDKKFMEKDGEEGIFGGLSKPDVMIEINGLLGDGMAEAMETSAKAGKGDHVYVALIKAIAEKKGLVGQTDALKQELMEVKRILGGRFPRLLENLG